jgi:hypothetical protein
MPRKNNKKFDKKKYNHRSSINNMYQNNNKKYRYNRNSQQKTQYRNNNAIPNVCINVSYPYIPMPVFTPYIHNNQYYNQHPYQHFYQHPYQQPYYQANRQQSPSRQPSSRQPPNRQSPYHNSKKKAFNAFKKNNQDMKNNKTTKEESKIFSIGEIDIIPENGLKSISTNTEFIDTLLGDIFGITKKITKNLPLKAPIVDENNFDLEKEYEKLPFKLKNLNDLIKLGKLYDIEKPHQYGINMKRLNYISDSLQNLNDVIGMNNVKQNIFNKVITYIQGLGKIDEMLNIVIQAPPGYGKTMLGYLLSEIFYKMGIIKKSKESKESKKKYSHPITHKEIDFPFIIAKRKDLIGEYLGQTAPKVEKKVKEAEGGVLFIDEAYSLGTTTDRKESYSESCLNTLNQLLSEKAGTFICIIAGYKNELKKSFFTNPGLERRFRLIFSIPKYKPLELTSIFNKMIIDDEWKLADSIIIDSQNSELCQFIKKNEDNFKYCGGDMEALLQNCRDAHSFRVIGKHPKLKKIITMKDIYNGYDLFIKNLDRKSDKNSLIYSMYA